MSSSAPNPAPLLALLLAGCGAASATPEPPRPTYAAIASGRIDAGGEARHLVAERDGIIAAVRVHEGERVVAGQPLLGLACADAEHAAAAASA
ncbi:MAG: secretion protein HlyD, partial [Alphaproteobacteria bacterium PA4]